jgi:hypothetical protein
MPLVGEYGIPVHDELDLCRVHDPGARDFPALPPWSKRRLDPLATARKSFALRPRSATPP